MHVKLKSNCCNIHRSLLIDLYDLLVVLLYSDNKIFKIFTFISNGLNKCKIKLSSQLTIGNKIKLCMFDFL